MRHPPCPRCGSHSGNTVHVRGYRTARHDCEDCKLVWRSDAQ